MIYPFPDIIEHGPFKYRREIPKFKQSLNVRVYFIVSIGFQNLYSICFQMMDVLSFFGIVFLYMKLFNLVNMTKFNFNTSLERSQNMSKIHSKNTRPEMLLRKALWSEGIRYRLNVSTLPGKPDIVMKKFKLAIFVDGSFWHGYNWDEKKLRIKANSEYWIKKIERNIERDKENNIALQKKGYTVLRFWDHQIKRDTQSCVSQIKLFLEIK